MLVTCQWQEEVTWSCLVLTQCCGVLSGGMYELDRVSRGGDTDVSGVDTVVSCADSRCQEVVMPSYRVLTSLCMVSIRCWHLVS